VSRIGGVDQRIGTTSYCMSVAAYGRKEIEELRRGIYDEAECSITIDLGKGMEGTVKEFLKIIQANWKIVGKHRIECERGGVQADGWINQQDLLKLQDAVLVIELRDVSSLGCLQAVPSG